MACPARTGFEDTQFIGGATTMVQRNINLDNDDREDIQDAREDRQEDRQDFIEDENDEDED
jgi:hypothetical protein